MTEVIELMLRITDDIRLIKAYLQTIRKSKVELFSESWIDGQDVMQALHISKRTLQTFRDSGILHYSRINGKFYYKVEDIEALLESKYTGQQKTRRIHGTD